MLLKNKNCSHKYVGDILDLTLRVRKNLKQADPKIQIAEMKEIDDQALSFWTENQLQAMFEKKLEEFKIMSV